MSMRLTWNLRWRLSVLWFLEWGITGAVMTYLPIYWESINLSKHQQSQLFLLQLANYPLELIHDSLVTSALNSLSCRLKTLRPAQTNDHLCTLDLLGGQTFEHRKLALLFRVIHRQVANGCLLLLHA